MRLERFTFGSIGIDGVTYEHDVVIDRRARDTYCSTRVKIAPVTFMSATKVPDCPGWPPGAKLRRALKG